MKSVSFLNQPDSFVLSQSQIAVKSAHRYAIILAAIVMISACGGGGGDSSPTPNLDSLIPGGSIGGDASGVADDELLRTAANRAGAGLGANLSNLGRLSNDAQGNLENGQFTGDFLGSIDPEMDQLDSLDSSNSSFLNNSLGIDDPGARTNREGNIITIDPDDQSVCGGGIPLGDGVTEDLTQCQQLVSDLMVQIDARSEEAGIITYLFQNAPVLLIGYSPMGASYELRLAGLQRVTDRVNELNGDDAAPVTMTGALRLAGTVLNSEPGSEAGELSLNVTEAIQLATTDSEAGFTLQPSTVFALSLDEASGDVSMGVNWGALQLISTSGDSDGNSSMASINLGGLSGELSFNENQPAFQISNIGIGNVPLNVSIDSVESVSLSLANFGISIDNDTGMINLDGALNASLMLNNLAGVLEDRALDFGFTSSVSAPAGTSLVRQGNGTTQVSAGGPLTATLIGGDSILSGQSEVSIEAGECFSAADDSVDSNEVTAAIAEVPCN